METNLAIERMREMLKSGHRLAGLEPGYGELRRADS
jgi:hypothetical protein